MLSKAGDLYRRKRLQNESLESCTEYEHDTLRSRIFFVNRYGYHVYGIYTLLSSGAHLAEFQTVPARPQRSRAWFGLGISGVGEAYSASDYWGANS